MPCTYATALTLLLIFLSILSFLPLLGIRVCADTEPISTGGKGTLRLPNNRIIYLRFTGFRSGNNRHVVYSWFTIV